MTLNSYRSGCLSLLHAGIKGIHHNAWHKVVSHFYLIFIPGLLFLLRCFKLAFIFHISLCIDCFIFFLFADVIVYCHEDKFQKYLMYSNFAYYLPLNIIITTVAEF